MKIKDYIGNFASFSDAAAGLSDTQKEIILAIYRAGGGNLYVSSLYRPGGSVHGKNMAVDATSDDLPLIFQTWDRMRGYWPGGLGIGINDADRHIHADRGDKIPGYRPADSAYYFIETGKAGSDGIVPVVGYFPSGSLSQSDFSDRYARFMEARSIAMDQYKITGLPASYNSSAGWTGTVTVGTGGFVIGLAQGLKSGLLDYRTLGPKRAAINAIPSVVVPTVAGALMGRAVDLAYAAIKKLF